MLGVKHQRMRIVGKSNNLFAADDIDIDRQENIFRSLRENYKASVSGLIYMRAS